MLTNDDVMLTNDDLMLTNDAVMFKRWDERAFCTKIGVFKIGVFILTNDDMYIQQVIRSRTKGRQLL